MRFGEKLLDVETAGLVDEHPGVFMPLDAEARLLVSRRTLGSRGE